MPENIATTLANRILERDAALSQSVIWRLQREFYMQRGLKAWTEDMVPQYITNNPFITEIYARVVADFLSDCVAHGDSPSPENPLRILELGAGPGRFSCLFLRHLTALLRERNISLQAVRYCMTDCSESAIQAWRENTYLAEFVATGNLEFARFQVGDPIQLPFLDRKSGPLVVIANYVLDSLPQDAFVINQGKLLEALITTESDTAKPADAPVDFSRLRFSYNNADVSRNRYSDSALNDILELYRKRLSSATIFFPSSALQILRELRERTSGGMMFLVADKGYAHEDSLARCQSPPTIELHGPNCFSQMVNLDAIAKYFQAQGGEAMLPDKHSAGLNICAFVQGRAGDGFPNTSASYRAAQETIGPDDVFTLLAWLNAHMEEMSVPQILSMLRLTRWDPIAFSRIFPVLARQIRSVPAEHQDMRTAVMKIWSNFYPVHPSENAVAFQCGVVLTELGHFEDALAMFKTSERILGRSAATSFNMGLCSQSLGHLQEALAFMTEACEQDSAFEPAQAARRKLAELQVSRT
jgi:tetratricopeptide (TPR) repeat protein